MGTSDLRPRFSIRYKFLVVVSLLLASCVALYLSLAIRVFKDDKQELIYDLNRSMVSNLASEVETELQSVSQKLELFTILAQLQGGKSRLAHQVLERGGEIAWAIITNPLSKAEVAHFQNEEILKTYEVGSAFFRQKLPELRQIPYKKIQENGEEIWNATIEGGPPLIGYGRSVIREDSDGKPREFFAAVAYIRADRFIKALNVVQQSDSFIAGQDGQLLVHSKTHFMFNPESVKELNWLAPAFSNSIRTQVHQFDWKGSSHLGAFSKAYNSKILVASSITHDVAFAAANSLTRRSILFGLIVVTVAFISAVLLSASLTRPLQTLMGGMEKVGEGDLNTRISIQSKDEIAVLALRFNKMIQDLKNSRDQLEEINRELENKVRERTRQLEEQNRAVKEAQEALLRTTRLASVGEIAGRAAHEVLNPLTALMTRVQKVQKRLKKEFQEETNLISEIQKAWTQEFQSGGFEKLKHTWASPSQVMAGKTLWDEDLGNIDGATQNLKREIDQLLKDADFLLSEGQRINKIVGGMRSLSVVRSNKEVHSAHKVLHECVNIMGDLFLQENIEVKESYEATQDNIEVDRDELIQSVTNLLRNSLQAVVQAHKEDGRKGRVQIRTSVQNNQLQIDLEDNGVGIPQDLRTKLFESQISTKPHSDGTGLGLSISRRFVRAFGGDIQLLDTEVGRKTTFRVTLPLSSKNNKEVAA